MSEFEPPGLINPYLNPVQTESGEVIEPKPFVIRGHHLIQFAVLINKHGVTPQGLAKGIRSITERPLRDYSVTTTVTRQKAEKSYMQDVLGKGLRYARKYEEHLTQTFNEFLRLPDNHPAKIVEEIPDIICVGCAVGKHCYPSRLDIAPTLVTEDTRYVDEFLRRVDGINWLSKLRGEDQLPELAIQKQTIFPDAEPNARKINTTLGVVKEVLTRKPNEKSIFFRLL